MIVGIDPGPEESGIAKLSFGRISSVVLSNRDVRALLPALAEDCSALAIEFIAGSYGNVVGTEVMMTAVWIGRFMEASGLEESAILLPPRKTVATHHTQNPRANDSAVRQALIDRYGGKDKAIGRKADPGPLYGIKSHAWPALAVALYAIDTLGIQ